MGLFSSRWHEVFFSTSAEQFFRGQNVLREHGIEFKTKTENRAFRESMNNINGRNPALGRVRFDSESGDTYRIFVAEENAAAARFLLQNCEQPYR
ncbi:putative signal transducing protein [Faecalispora anaeroviscerum]|uniref:hypothetical protein n=1 Tax=Faecalispora anaeroviscerum TaxID=2991836 RepID=UPI0024BA982B|nr:hypothetical protein [Faecalispora anaeroviscerum]